jgi:phage tail-like protein
MSVDVPQLIVRFQGQVVQRVALTQDVLTIGRTPDNELSLPHPLIARRHAELRVGEERTILTDLGSGSGTFIGEARLLPNQPQAIPDGAVFRIGPFELTYEQTASARSAELPGEPEGQAALPVMPPRALAGPRPTHPMLAPIGPLSRYLADLPAIYQGNDFLGRFLLIIEGLWEPLEQRTNHLPMYFDPHTCPAPMLPWLAGWLDIGIDRLWPEARQRAILAEAMDLLRWRGTRFGLARMIELATGISPEIIDEPGQHWVMRVRMTIPEPHEVDRLFLETLIQSHKPAHVGYILELR